MSLTDALGLDPDDIPAADDRDFFDGIELDYVTAHEPEDLYDEDDPGLDHAPTETTEPR